MDHGLGADCGTAAAWRGRERGRGRSLTLTLTCVCFKGTSQPQNCLNLTPLQEERLKRLKHRTKLQFDASNLQHQVSSLLFSSHNKTKQTNSCLYSITLMILGVESRILIKFRFVYIYIYRKL